MQTKFSIFFCKTIYLLITKVIKFYKLSNLCQSVAMAPSVNRLYDYLVNIILNQLTFLYGSIFLMSTPRK